MIKPNWNIFKAKFSDNPQNYFEWFCYLLFCKEHNKEYIFRFKNQAAIETDPITISSDVIGWQAKFYDVALSKKSSELIETIVDTKKYYPSVTKLIIYTNQECGQNKGKNPDYFDKIHKTAKNYSIELELRTASYFESDFVTSTNESLSLYFFSNNKTVIDVIDSKNSHSEFLLSGIKTFIPFRKNEIKINRQEIIDKIKNSNKKIIILSGKSGNGKTAIIKELYEQLNKTIPFFIFRATELDISDINILFNNSTEDFLTFYAKYSKKIIVIDSAEKLNEIRNKDIYEKFIYLLNKNSWQIIFTTQEYYLPALNDFFTQKQNITIDNINIPSFDYTYLSELSTTYNFLLPTDKKLIELIQIPFYLSEYLKDYDPDDKLKISDFKLSLWHNNIVKNKPTRELLFLELAFKRANELTFYISVDSNTEILDKEFIRDGILGYDTNGYFITHDIYEDLALEVFFKKKFNNRENNSSFFNNIGNSPAIQKNFRNWLIDNLSSEEFKVFIEECIMEDIDNILISEMFISILLSDFSEEFFRNHKIKLLENNNELLKTFCSLLSKHCFAIDFQKNLQNNMASSSNTIKIKPYGNGWNNLIKFCYENISKIPLDCNSFIIPILREWNSFYKSGSTTKLSSLVALKILEKNKKKSLLKL